MEFTTPRLRLREFKETDFPALRAMDCIPGMHTYERELPGETITRNSLNEYLHNQFDIPRTTYNFAIITKPGDTVRGLIKFSRLQQAIREWEIGWAVHPDDWGNGYATEAASCVMDWAFNGLNVHRVAAFCHVDNLASVRVMTKLGMHQDGRLRGVRWLSSQWCDEYMYAILDREWDENKRLGRGKG